MGSRGRGVHPWHRLSVCMVAINRREMEDWRSSMVGVT